MRYKYVFFSILFLGIAGTVAGLWKWNKGFTPNTGAGTFHPSSPATQDAVPSPSARLPATSEPPHDARSQIAPVTPPPPTPEQLIGGQRDRMSRISKKLRMTDKLRAYLPPGWKLCEQLRAHRANVPADVFVEKVAGYNIASSSFVPADGSTYWVVMQPDRKLMGVVTGYVLAKLSDGASATEVADDIGVPLVQEYKNLGRAAFRVSLDDQTLSKLNTLKTDGRIQNMQLEVQYARAVTQ